MCKSTVDTSTTNCKCEKGGAVHPSGYGPDAGYVEVVCLVLPTGENLWFEAAKGQDYMRQVIDKWKSEHPEFTDTPCNMGAVHITMPRAKYNAIGAHFGHGCFVWP